MPAPRLGWWNVYFLAKLALYWKGFIGFHALENLAFAALLLIPLRSRRLRIARTIVAIPVGVALLYYDSWLPPFERLVAQWSLVARFSPAYLAELAGRFVSWPAVAAIAIGAACYAILAPRIRVGALVMTALVVLAALEKPVGVGTPAVADQAGAPSAPQSANSGVRPAEPQGLEAALRDFYDREGTRRVTFANSVAGAAPFDVVFLHVCSLSWDDLSATGLQDHPLFARFDILLTRFNSAASYSGPAVIRMLRATCGQTSHAGLYSPAPEHCYLLSSLERVGFELDIVLNHDGHFDDFLKVVRAQVPRIAAPLALAGLPVAQRSFDDSPIYDDLAVLTRWLSTREAPRPRAVYFNTISLHDGNRLTGAQARLGSLGTYKIRLEKLLEDLGQFMARLEREPRPTVVVLVPEHGAAFRSDKMQIAGMREIPTPAITLVPAGVKVVGSGLRRVGETVRIDGQTSYLALSHIIARMLEQSPFSATGFSPQEYVTDLPSTPFVAENSGTVMIRRGDKYYLRIDKEGWSEYSTPLL